MIKLVLAAMAGAAGHQMSSIIDGWEAGGLPPAWSRIARYIVGGIIVLPVYVLIRRGVEVNEETEKDIQSYIMAFFGVGFGVSVGYLLDDLKVTA